MTETNSTGRAGLRPLLAIALVGGVLGAGWRTDEGATAAGREAASVAASVAGSPPLATAPANPCGDAHAPAAELLGTDADDLYPGERYPTTGSCVFWSRVRPGDFVIVQLEVVDRERSPWPCGPDQAVHEAGPVDEVAIVSMRACTTP